MYNQGVGSIDLVNQRTSAYHLDRKSLIRFFLRIFFFFLLFLLLLFFCFLFFYFVNVACVSTFIVYNMIHQNNLTLLDYKTIVSTHLIEQIVAENHQIKKLDQRENISTILSLTICDLISLNFNRAENVVNTAAKKDLREKR